ASGNSDWPVSPGAPVFLTIPTLNGHGGRVVRAMVCPFCVPAPHNNRNARMLDQSEIELFRTNVRKYLEKEIGPHYAKWEKEEILPREVWTGLGENGFLCVDVPEE